MFWGKKQPPAKSLNETKSVSDVKTDESNKTLETNAQSPQEESSAPTPPPFVPHAFKDDPNVTSIIEIRDVRKTFKVGGQDVEILKGISVDIEMGEFTIVLGPSGCGKSTLLHIILGLEAPSSGSIKFLGEELYSTDKNEDYRSSFRKMHIGMIYQQPNWIKSMTVVENIAFPLMLLGMEKRKAIKQAHLQLEKVEMQNWAHHIPTELSSGQQQRVALARGLANHPQIIIADEPTGNLDFKSGQEMMELLARLNAEQKNTIVMVTHDLEYLKFANRAIQMLDGQIVKVHIGQELQDFASTLQTKRGTTGTGDGKVTDLYHPDDQTSPSPKHSIHYKGDTIADLNDEKDAVPKKSKPTKENPGQKELTKQDEKPKVAHA